jgi:hypothetical protein
LALVDPEKYEGIYFFKAHGPIDPVRSPLSVFRSGDRPAGGVTRGIFKAVDRIKKKYYRWDKMSSKIKAVNPRDKGFPWKTLKKKSSI